LAIIIGNQIILPHATWEKFIARREDIKRLTPDEIPVEIDNIIVKVVKIYNTHIIKLSSHDTSMYLKSSTILFLFKLDRCVEHIYSEICQYTYVVNEKFRYFVTYLHQNCNNKRDAVNILRKIYDKSSLIDCELIVYTLNNIVYDAFHEK